MPKAKRNTNSKARDNNLRRNIKHGAYRYPADTLRIVHKPFKLGVKSPYNVHMFCAYCGRELTEFNLENGQVQFKHYMSKILSQEYGELFYCLPYEACAQRRKVSMMKKDLKVKVSDYLEED